jgi:hypothetical protein
LQACLVSEAPLTAARDNEGMMMAPVQRILAAASVGEETAGPVEGRSQPARLSMSMRQGWFVILFAVFLLMGGAGAAFYFYFFFRRRRRCASPWDRRRARTRALYRRSRNNSSAIAPPSG